MRSRESLGNPTALWPQCAPDADVAAVIRFTSEPKGGIKVSPRAVDRTEIYEVAQRFVGECLKRDGSLFTPEQSIWTLPVIDDLYERFVNHPDTSRDPFTLKLARQLDAAPDAALQLMAEVLFVHFLPGSNVGGKRKRELITEVLGWMNQPIEMPPDLDSVLDTGLMNMGVAFNTGRNFGIAFLLDFTRTWKHLPSADRAGLLVDPWGFKDLAYGVPMFAAHSQRETLLHLVHPDSFENIANRQHKHAIAAAYGDRAAGASDDVDHNLAEIRASLEKEHGRHIDFYETGIYERWHGEPAANPPGIDAEQDVRPVAQRAWLIRGTTRAGDSLVPTWIGEGFASIGWLGAGQIEPGTSRNEIRERIRESAPDDPPGKVGQGAGIVHKFINEMRVGDLVIAPQRGNIYVGIVTSDPVWRPAAPGEPPQLSRRREVEWANPGSPVARSSLSEGLYSTMRTLLTLTDVTDYADEIASIAGITDEIQVPVKASVVAELPAANSELENATLLPLSWLQEVIELLERKRQIVFYGPPGTSKTFVAQRLGDHVVAAGGNFRLVQFHPSYTYEDFFEGFRPRASANEMGIGFELVSGPLREMAGAARDDPSHPYLLIIDEINRANISKVFGELFFLLEYRDAAVSLLYSPGEDFYLPKNLYIVGTMNTADRSIALIDTAMRRRFYFFRFSPEMEPIASLLSLWLRREGLGDEPARLLSALNQEIDDPDFAIGPSYFMDTRIAEEGELERVWTHALLPLLEEHFFGTEVNVSARFGLAPLRARDQVLNAQDEPDLTRNDAAAD